MLYGALMIDETCDQVPLEELENHRTDEEESHQRVKCKEHQFMIILTWVTDKQLYDWSQFQHNKVDKVAPKDE